MPNKSNLTLRERLTQASWQLTELAGGPWIIYGFNGNAELCVMGKTRPEAWQKAWDTAEALSLISPSANGKATA
jgi:hypothetical protein